jgi:hypothetical protein
MGLGVTDALRAVIRAAVGLDVDPGTPPDLMRLGLYPAQVQAVASDGSTLDVAPADTRISGEKNVQLRVGVPGQVAIVQPGAVVLLGWEGGDPKRPYCVPHWDQGANVSKLTFNATAIELAGNTYSAQKTEDLFTDMKAFIGAVIADLASAAAAPVSPYSATVNTTQLFIKMVTGNGAAYKSTKVKNG